jgi:hypothetical protein
MYYVCVLIASLLASLFVVLQILFMIIRCVLIGVLLIGYFLFYTFILAPKTFFFFSSTSLEKPTGNRPFSTTALDLNSDSVKQTNV